MPRIPKYKTDALSAYKYAKKNGPLEDEKIFFKDAEIAIKYALDAKEEKLSEPLHNFVCDYYKNIASLCKEKSCPANQRLILCRFFDYIYMCGGIGDEEELLDRLHPTVLTYYAAATRKRLSPKHEKIIFEYSQESDNLEPLLEYSYFVKSRFPDYIHNFLILKSLENNKNVSVYFDNLKKIKNYLEKVFDGFDENMTLKEFLEQF
jgi:hypothetical protein